MKRSPPKRLSPLQSALPVHVLSSVSSSSSPARQRRGIKKRQRYMMMIIITASILFTITTFTYQYSESQVTLLSDIANFKDSFLPTGITAASARRTPIMSVDEIIKGQEFKNNKLLLKKREMMTDNSNSNAASSNKTNKTKVLINLKNEFEHDGPPSSENKNENENKVGEGEYKKNDEEIEIEAETKNKKKKFFLLHIGPSRTGSTSIQMDSSSSSDPRFIKALQKDGVIYVGEESTHRQQFQHNLDCSKAFVSRALDQQLQTNTFVFDMPGVNGMSTPETICTSKKCLIDCWNHNNDNSQFKNSYNMLGYSIIDSNKELSWKMGQEVMQRFVKKFTYKETDLWTDHLDYTEFIGVVTYRRYYDWLLSVYKSLTQSHCIVEPQYVAEGTKGDEVDMVTRTWQEQFSTRKQSLWPKDGGERCPSIWLWINGRVKAPHYNARYYQNLDVMLPVMRSVLLSPHNHTGSGSDGGTTTTTTRNSVRILNYYQDKGEYNSITTELYCGILGNDRTPNTCEYAKKSLGDNVTFHKKSDDLTKVLYDEIVVAASDRGWFSNSSDNNDDIRIINSKYKDSKNFSDISTHHPITTQRIRARNHLIDYHTKTLNKTFSDFPLMCPSKDQLQQLLDKSLKFEKMVLPEFDKTPLGEEKHIRDFWNSHQTELTYCWVDIGQLFKDVNSWDEVLKISLTKRWSREPKRVKIS
jgi:hypothetical protein